MSNFLCTRHVKSFAFVIFLCSLYFVFCGIAAADPNQIASPHASDVFYDLKKAPKEKIRGALFSYIKGYPVIESDLDLSADDKEVVSDLAKVDSSQKNEADDYNHKETDNPLESYTLGKTEYNNKNYGKAAIYFLKSYKSDPNAQEALSAVIMSIQSLRMAKKYDQACFITKKILTNIKGERLKNAKTRIFFKTEQKNLFGKCNQKVDHSDKIHPSI